MSGDPGKSQADPGGANQSPGETRGARPNAFAGRSPAELSDTIGQLHALSSAALAVMFEAIAAYDATEAWRQDGAGSLGQWLSYFLGVTTTTGVEYARVANALVDLPVTSSALAAGELGYEQVRALTRGATADTEAGLVHEATGRTATQVEQMMRALKEVSTDEAQGANRRRSLRLRWSVHDRMLRLSGRLPEVDGALVASTIQAIAERSAGPSLDDDPEREPWDARCADALVELCACPGGGAVAGALRNGTDGVDVERNEVGSDRCEAQGGASDATATQTRRVEAEVSRAQIVVHVEADVLASEGVGTAALECGVPVASETVRRLGCDGWIQGVVEGAGRPLGVGRRQRTVPRSLLRVLRHRDGGCRFPGCTRTQWVHAHHIVFWADGGATDVQNLVLLCGAHHRFVHEGGGGSRGTQPGSSGSSIRTDGSLGWGPRGCGRRWRSGSGSGWESTAGSHGRRGMSHRWEVSRHLR